MGESTICISKEMLAYLWGLDGDEPFFLSKLSFRSLPRAAENSFAKQSDRSAVSAVVIPHAVSLSGLLYIVSTPTVFSCRLLKISRSYRAILNVCWETRSGMEVSIFFSELLDFRC